MVTMVNIKTIRHCDKLCTVSNEIKQHVKKTIVKYHY